MSSIILAIIVGYVIYFGIGRPLNNEYKATISADKYVKVIYPWLCKSLNEYTIEVYDEGHIWVVAWVLYDDTGYSVEGGGGPCISLSKSNGVLKQFYLME